MVKRFHDVPYHTFSFWTDMMVVCPMCGKAGTVRFDKERGTAVFRCESCYAKKETLPCGSYAFEVTAQCTSTGRHFRKPVSGGKIHGEKVRIKCPYCAEIVIGNVSDKRSRQVVLTDIRHAEDPYFHYPLYFQADYRGNIIWALNREHLQYLIDYLSADLRMAPSDIGQTLRSQSDRLPAFMKTAKNRDGIVKLLTKLQEKR